MAIRRIEIVLEGETKVHEFDKDQLVIGRLEPSDILVPTSSISRQHARLSFEGDKIFLTDLGSMNGTFVNDLRLVPHLKASVIAGESFSVGGRKVLVTVLATMGTKPSRLPQPSGETKGGLPNTQIMPMDLAETSEFAAPRESSVEKSNPTLALDMPFDLSPIPEFEEPSKSSTLRKPPKPLVLQKKKNLEEESEPVSVISERSHRIRNLLLKEIEEAEHRLEALRAQVDETEQKLNESESEKRLRLTGLESELREAERAAAHRQAESREMIAKLEAQMESVTQQLSRGLEEFESLKEELRARKEEVHGLVEQGKAYEAMLAQGRLVLMREKEGLAQVREEQREVSLRVRSLEAELLAKTDDVKAIASQRETLLAECRIIERRLEERRADLTNEEATRLARIAELRPRIEESEKRLLNVQSELSALESRVNERKDELEENFARFSRLREEESRLTLSRAQAQSELDALLNNIVSSKAENQRLVAQQERLVAEVLDRETKSLSIEQEYLGVQRQFQYMQEELALAERKQRTQAEALAEELRLSSLRLEREFEEAQTRKATLLRENQVLVDELDRARNDAVRERESLAAARRDREQLDREYGEIVSRSDSLKQEVEVSLQSKARLVEEIAAMREAERDLHSRHEQLRLEARAEVERESRALIDGARAEAAQSRAAMDAELLERRELAQREHTERVRKTESDLALLRLKEMKNIDEARTRAEKERESQAAHAVREAHRALDEAGLTQVNGSAEGLVALKKRLESVILGEAPSDDAGRAADEAWVKVDFVAASKAKAFWRRSGLGIGATAGLALMMVIFPSIPRAGRDFVAGIFYPKERSIDRMLASIKEARDNRPLFRPARDKHFRKSYADNIVYTEGYQTFKTDPAQRKEWVLALNKYMADQIPNGDQLFADFVASESVLIRELAESFNRLLEEDQNAGLQKMHEMENQFRQESTKLLGSEANYDKILAFEASYCKSHIGTE